MTGPDATTTNTAADSAYVGVQAGTVHGDIYTYMTSANPSPEEKFNAGARYLDGGMSEKAWQLVNDAVMEKYVTNKVYFYWLLALVSNKTWHNLSEEEIVTLRAAQNILHLTGDDAWARGVKTIDRLLEAAQNPDTDIRILLKEFDDLGKTQRDMVLRHMQSFLNGALEEQMWGRALQRAELEQMAGQRVHRVWKFFQPDPRAPRERPLQEPMVRFTSWIQGIAATGVLVAATVHIGYLLVREGQAVAFLALLLSIANGYIGARNGVEWCFRSLRRRVKDQAYRTPPPRRTSTPSGGFANKVDQRFDYYFNKYVPRGVERNAWISATAGIRRIVRDEIVGGYRESRVGVEKISWLIRHRVSNVKRRWQDGTLWDYRQELATPLATRAKTILSLAVFSGAGIWAVGSAIPASPLSATLSTVFVLAGGWIAARTWLHIILERRRFAADTSEARQELHDSMQAFARWKAKLADRPADQEMATWLDYDRKVLLNEALQHYKLSMSNVIAYAFIEAPAFSSKRARVLGGPWRYMKYQLIVFLLTTDGVRQFTVQLDFEQGIFHDRQRLNYRYEAVAAVKATQADNDERTFELSLVNGQEITIQIIAPGMEELQQGETPGAVSDVTLDAAGLHRTLHVLEGIAAEGKEWITQKYLRRDAA